MKRASAISAFGPAIVLGAALALAGCRGKSLTPVEVPRGIDHRSWNRLLHEYVDQNGLVDYGRWKASAADSGELAGYLAQFAAPASPPATGNEKDAALVNAYNAFTISWILDHYPTESIQSISGSFTGTRLRIGGREVSLDEIEKATVVPEVGFRAHAVFVCAARSCPPLARDAYSADRFIGQISFAMLRWLERDDLNHFDPQENRAEISPIFRSYANDFVSAKGGLRGVLSLYAPDPDRAFVVEPSCRISYKSYDWGLNDQGPHGRKYGTGWWDRLKSGVGLKKS